MREDQDDAGEDHQDEPVAQSILDRTVMLREAFWKSRGDRDSAAHDYRDRFRIAQAQGRAPAGPFAEEANSADLAVLGEWLDQAREAGARDLADWQEIRIGRGDEFASADRLLDEIVLEVAIPRADSAHTRTVKIHGALGFVSPAMDASIRCVLRDEPKAKDFLPLFFSALALAASGATDAMEFAAIVVSGAGGSGKRRIKRFRLPPPEAARAYLAAIAADLLSDENYYFLPIEAVEKIWRAWKGTKKRSRRGRCRSYRSDRRRARERAIAMQLGLRADPQRAPLRPARGKRAEEHNRTAIWTDRQHLRVLRTHRLERDPLPPTRDPRSHPAR